MPVTGSVYDGDENERKAAVDMRRRMRWILPVLTAVLLAFGLWCARMCRPSVPLNDGGGSASLGLVLLNAEQGVYVLAVSAQSTAELAGLEPGDYILSAQGEALGDITALDAQLQSSQELHLSVRRGDELLELLLPGR